MRVLLLTSSSPFDEITGPLAAGAEIAMRRIGEKLAARGHRVTYLTLADGEEATARLGGVEVHVLSRRGPGGPLAAVRRLARRVARGLARQARGTQPGGRLAGAARRRLDGMTVGREPGRGPLLERLRRLVDEGDVDLIHCNSSLPDPLVAAVVGRERGIPVVVRVGGRYWHLRYQRLGDEGSRARYREELAFAFGNVQCFAYNSETLRRQTAEMLAELGLEGPPHEVVIDIGVEAPADASATGDSLAALDELPSGLLVSAVGKFKEGSKRQDLLVRALALFGDEAAVTVAFAGEGPTRDEIERLAVREGVRDRVLFLGSLPHAAVFELLRRSDVVAHPTDFEGSSKALAEAMLCGRPVVASDVPAMHEHLEDGVNGLLAANTAQGFAAALGRLLADRDLRDRLGAAARAYAERAFDPAAGVVEYEKLFARLIAEGRRPGQGSA